MIEEMTTSFSPTAKEARRQEADGMTIEELTNKVDDLIVQVHTLSEDVKVLEKEKSRADHAWEAKHTLERHEKLKLAEENLEARRKERDCVAYEAGEWASHLQRRSMARRAGKTNR